MKQPKQYLLLFLLFFVLSSFTFAVPPFVEDQTFIGNIGLQIEYPLVPIGKINMPYDAYFHVFNLSNGYNYREGDIINCTLHIYNPLGQHIYSNWSNVWVNTFDIEISLNSNTFNTTGFYSYIIQCENENLLGGFSSSSIEITKNGKENNKTIFLPLIFAIFSFCALLLYLAFKLEDLHSFLKLFIIFIVINIQYITATLILNLTSETSYEGLGLIGFMAITWFIRIFWVYVIIYLSYYVLDFFGKLPTSIKDKGWKK